MLLAFGERLIDEFCRYAPNFRDAIIDWMLLTLEDIEDRIGSRRTATSGTSTWFRNR